MCRGFLDWKRIAYRVLVGRLENTIKMNLIETGCKGVGWFHLAEDREQWPTVVNTVMHIRLPRSAEYFFTK
jgi:hypothetical protein